MLFFKPDQGAGWRRAHFATGALQSMELRAPTGGMLLHSQQAPRALWHKADGFVAGTILLMGG